MPQVIEKSLSPQTADKPKSRWQIWLTTFFWAFALFAVINFVLWKVAGEEKAASKDLWNGTGSIDLALDGLAALKQKPTVVLLGSSLMMYPFWAMDKQADKNIPDIFHHHFSHEFENKLAQAGMKNPTVYSLAIFGQMSSDAYIYVNDYLKGNKAPEFLVFGIAPRDFSDYDLPSPTATYTFKRLVGLANFDRYANLYLPNWQDRLEFYINHTCFFYARRWRLQKDVDKILEKVYSACGLSEQTSDNKSSDNTAGFMLSGSTEQRWNNSLNEYRRRYKNIADRDLSIQIGFLNRLLTVCQERHIKVILMNMPLTDVNRAILPQGFYDGYRTQVGDIARAHNAQFIDMGASPDFNHDDFWDTTHLNHLGGHKLLEKLLPLMVH